MQPIGILQHEVDTPPGYFVAWLEQHGLPFTIVRLDLGESVPTRARDFSGLCFMGGAMSVNDSLPFIEPECALIRDADAAGVPVIGHCLGGQLIAKALGAPVTRHRVKEIGWQPLAVTDAALADEWLGPDAPRTMEIFQWHGDTFALPPGARNFLASPLCAHQAYVIDRGSFAHLGMQFHCEMTPELVQDWTTTGAEEIAQEQQAGRAQGVQDVAEIRRDLQVRSVRLNAIAARLYARWARGLQGQ
ncbi:MAG: type 1 glutamine amidotransferase [Burkholderiales bacterium]|jgi:GMP synthase-like glutamine amidotransferase|nr:type 1 glutamine amidotransferase [Burkholderiales bacterium]